MCEAWLSIGETETLICLWMTRYIKKGRPDTKVCDRSNEIIDYFIGNAIL